jgi:TPR repeat protein
MRRFVLVAVSCALVALVLVLVVSGAFRGRDPQPAGAPAADGADKPAPAQPAEGQPGERPVAQRHEPYPFKRVVVIAIGINQYENLRGTTDLRFAEADAAEFADVCEKLYGYEVVRLPREKATKREIELVLKKYGRELGDEDALVAFFAGHGQVVPLPNGDEAGFLLPYDADLDMRNTANPEEWAAQALDMHYLADLLNGMNARHVVFLADACCSGFMTRRGAMERADLKTFLFGEKSRTIVAATTRRQASREDAAAKHGYFTAAFLDELRKDDAASVLDLYVPVMKRVAAKTNGAMTPQFAQIGDGDGMFVFIPKSIPRSQVEADLNSRTLTDAPARGLAGVQARARERLGARTTFEQVVEAFESPPYRYSATPEESHRRWEAKFARYQLNAGLGDAWAMAALHFCYAKGLGTEKSPERAYYWARQADRFKSPAGVGRFLLGRCYETGVGVEKNERAAEKLLGEAADAGFPLALYARGDRVASRVRPGAPDLRPGERAAAEKDLTRAFDAGVTSASVPLSRFTFYDPKPDRAAVAAAVKRLEAAAKNDVPEAHHALWAVYARDRENFPAKDLLKAEEHLLRAGGLGYAFSQRVLAVEHYRKRPYDAPLSALPQNFQEAFRWASLAAAQDDPGGHFILSLLYRDGDGVAIDHDRMKKHLEEAARLKYPAALNALCWHLAEGKYYRQDFPRAFQLAKQSAELGDGDGHYAVGFFYHAIVDPKTGKFVPDEDKLALEYHANSHHTIHHYFQAFKRNKHPKAKEYLETYANWFVNERENGLGNFRRIAPPGSHAPSTVMNRLKETYPETAKEFAAAFQLNR